MARALWLKSALVFVLMAVGAQAWAEGPRYDCRSGLLDRVFDRVVGYGTINDPIDFRPRAKRVRLVYKTSPGLAPVLNAAIEARTAEMAEEGYVREWDALPRPGPKLELNFRREPRLLAVRERRAEPAWVAEQRARLREKFPRARFRDRLYASKSERYETDTPDSTLLLTAKTLAALEPGLYAFVRVTGENFLRLGSGHHLVGAGMVAMAAGDLSVVKDAVTGERRVESLSPRSDTYRPPDDTLVHALEALWRQGVYPREVRLLEWNNRDLILNL